MAIENISRFTIVNDSGSNIESSYGEIVELIFGRDINTGAVGYSVDLGSSWTWISAISPNTPLITSGSASGLTGYRVLTSGSNIQLNVANGSLIIHSLANTSAPILPRELAQDSSGSILTDSNNMLLYVEVT